MFITSGKTKKMNEAFGAEQLYPNISNHHRNGRFCWISINSARRKAKNGFTKGMLDYIQTTLAI
jgi:hypothetical protein